MSYIVFSKILLILKQSKDLFTNKYEILIFFSNTIEFLIVKPKLKTSLSFFTAKIGNKYVVKLV